MPLPLHTIQVRGLGVLLLSMAVVILPGPAAAHGWEPAAASFDDLMLQAEERRSEGAHLESARLYAQAYRALPPDEQIELMAEITVNNASADYRLAHEAVPDDIALLVEWEALLSEFVDARTAAHEANRAQAPSPGLLQDLEALRAEIDRRRGAAAESTPVIDEAESPAEQTRPPPTEPHSPEPVNPAADWAIIGVGAATFVGGIALLGAGASTLGRVGTLHDDQVTALQAEPGYTAQQRDQYQSQLDDWQQQGRSVGTGMIVGGAVLGAVGLGLTTWGAIRRRRHAAGAGAQARSSRPTVAIHRRGVSLAVRF